MKLLYLFYRHIRSFLHCPKSFVLSTFICPVQFLARKTCPSSSKRPSQRQLNCGAWPSLNSGPWRTTPSSRQRRRCRWHCLTFRQVKLHKWVIPRLGGEHKFHFKLELWLVSSLTASIQLKLTYFLPTEFPYIVTVLFLVCDLVLDSCQRTFISANDTNSLHSRL